MSATAAGAQPGSGGLHPLGVGETLDSAIKVYRNNAPTLWKIVALVIVPVYIVEVLVRAAALPGGTFVHNGALYVSSTNGQSSAGSTVALLLVTFLGLLAELLATGAVFKLLLDSYLGRTVDWRESFAFARGRVLSLLWLSILTTVLVLIGFVLIVVPGIWFIVAASVAVPVLMLEGLGGFAAVRRSMQLVRGRWWATFGRLLTALLLYIVVSIILGIIVGAIARGLSVSSVGLWLIINGLLSAVVTIVLSPFVAAVITTVYVDLRVRKEALDLELLASHSAAPGSGRGGTSPATSGAPSAPAAAAPEGSSPTSGSVPPPGFGDSPAPPPEPPPE